MLSKINFGLVARVIIFISVMQISSVIYSKVNQLRKEEELFPTVKLTQIPSLSPTSVNILENQTEATKIAPTADPDPITTCTSDLCGNIRIRGSQCTGENAYICCEVGSGNWRWYATLEDCKVAISVYKSNPIKSNFVYPTLIPLPTYAEIKFYDYDTTYQDSLSENESDQFTNGNYDTCMEDALNRYNIALQKSTAYSEGTKEALRQVARQEYDREISECK